MALDADALTDLSQTVLVATQLGDTLDHGLAQGAPVGGNFSVLYCAHYSGAMQSLAVDEHVAFEAT